MQRFVERDILVQFTLMTLVSRVAPNNSVHKMYQILFICLIIWDLQYMIRSQSYTNKEITFVGFILNSADITVRLPLEKKESTT